MRSAGVNGHEMTNATVYLVHTVMRYLIAAKMASLGGKAFHTLVLMQ